MGLVMTASSHDAAPLVTPLGRLKQAYIYFIATVKFIATVQTIRFGDREISAEILVPVHASTWQGDYKLNRLTSTDDLQLGFGLC